MASEAAQINPAPAVRSGWLETIATKKAQVDARVEGVALTTLEILVHFTFQYVFFIFYPAYEQLYDEKRVEMLTQRRLSLPQNQSSLFYDGVLFFHRFIAQPSEIGSIFPSSGSLVAAITRHVVDRRDPANADEPAKRYLDVGAGTGPFSQGIVDKMGPQDHLDIVEFDPNLCKLLRRKFRHLPNVAVHHTDFLQFNPGIQYDAITSGLPLNNFREGFVRDAHAKYLALAKEGKTVSYFEYKWLPAVRRAFMWGDSAANYDAVRGLKDQLEAGAEVDDVYLNMTPARAIHCVKPAVSAQ